jgi:hypothetical protein
MGVRPVHLTLLPDPWAEVGPFGPSPAEDLTVPDNESFVDRLAAVAVLSSRPGAIMVIVSR